MIREAEEAKAYIYEVPGKYLNGNKVQSTIVDEDYLLVGSYVDNGMRRKIIEGEYIDFAKLMPKDRIGVEDDHRMEMVNRGGGVILGTGCR